MKNILIVSDSHGSADLLHTLRERHSGEVDHWIHCGDSELTEESDALQGFTVVKGNCDVYGNFPEEVIIEAGGCKILVVHGHLYSVKQSLLKITYRAEETGADIVCFGHSHLLGAEKMGDILFINPGSIRLPRGRREQTYIILQLNNEKAVLNVYDAVRGKLDSLSQEFNIEK